MHFEEVEILHSWVFHVLAEAVDVNFPVSVEIKIAGKLIKNIVINDDTIVVKDIFKFNQRDLILNRGILNLLYESILLVPICDFFGDR